VFDCTENLQDNKELIIHTIAHAYETGILESPEYGGMLGTLLALLCEDKVQGKIGEDMTLGPIWSLTPEYEKQLMAEREALASKNVVIGPW
jgi:hypothetical protein